MILDCKEYCLFIGVHRNTLSKRIKEGRICEKHIVHKFGKRYFFEIINECPELELYIAASIEFHKKKGSHPNHYGLAAAICIENDLKVSILYKIQGLSV